MTRLPQLMVKVWDGDQDEYFTYLDMRRVEYNANICAREAGVDQVAFIEVNHDSQFRFDEAQKLENLILSTAQALGLTITIETAWNYNRTLSYVDFERWESNLWQCYQALGGVGERIPAGKVLVTVSAVLFADDWMGNGPYYQDIDVPSIYSDTESVFFVHHSADLIQRSAELNAELIARTLSDRKVRVWAESIRPTVNIPVRFAMNGLQMQTIINLPATSWQGTGPWTQVVTLPSTAVTDAILGAHEGMTDAQVQELMRCSITPSGVSGSSLTVRAIRNKPTMDLPIGIMYDTQEVE